MDERNIQHPDITAAERTGYPRRTFPPMPMMGTAYELYIKDNEQDFLDYCLGRLELVEDYIFSRHSDFQDWQYENYREVAY